MSWRIWLWNAGWARTRELWSGVSPTRSIIKRNRRRSILSPEQLLARRPDPRLHVPLRICHLQLWQSFHLIFTSELINLASFHLFHIVNYSLVARIDFRLSLRTRRVLFTANGMCSWSASSSPSSWSSLESLRCVLSPMQICVIS